MAFTRYRLFIGITFAFLCFQIQTFCDWNNDFLTKSHFLYKKHLSFQRNYLFYLSIIQEYQSLGLYFSNVSENYQKIRDASNKDKENYFYRDFILKKRSFNNINELFVWELSCILGLSEFVVPSIPYEIDNKKLIIQKIEPLTHGSYYLFSPPETAINHVSLDCYWKAHLLAFILGFGDLSGMNIGISTEGVMRFYDNEAVFHTNISPIQTKDAFFFFFVSVAFDWPQFDEPISYTVSCNLKRVVKNISDSKELLLHYGQERGISMNVIKDFMERIDLLSRFSLEEGMCMRDFFRSLYPRVDAGMEQLVTLASQITKLPLKEGSALFFFTRLIKFWRVTEEERIAIQAWIEHYL